MPPKGYLKRLREICDAHGILLVFDEVICGFGRTGETFAAQSFGVTPDMMTMAKGLTNGAQPMGAVAMCERIHDTIMAAAPEGAIEFFHGYTYSGHPASVRRGTRHARHLQERGLVRARPQSCRRTFLDAMFSLKRRADRHRHPRLRDVRDDRRAAGRHARRARPRCSRRSCSTTACNLKTTGDSAIIAPPLIAEKSHIDMIGDILRKTLASI